MQFRPVATGLFAISGFHLLGEVVALYRRLSVCGRLHQSLTWGDRRRLTVYGTGLAFDLGCQLAEQCAKPNASQAFTIYTKGKMRE